MKNLFFYYIAILTPLPIIIWVSYKKEKYLFFILIIIYFLYRGVIDGIRLYKLRVIKKKDILKTYNPIYNLKYFKKLYFGI